MKSILTDAFEGSMTERINVTKSFLPPIEEYEDYLRRIWDRDQLTNQGPLVLELQDRLKTYLGVDNFHFVTNGTLALQIALRSLGLKAGEVITTPFTYVATISSILWEGFEPVFVDIEPNTFCIDADKIEAAITPDTQAIMAVHVYGFPCNIQKIAAIAKKHSLKVIYDGAHSFGVKVGSKSLLAYGDISICSFHATKPFHTIEGGCVIANGQAVSDRVELIKRFGHNEDNHYMLGINAKASEFQAAMGLCNLKYINDIIAARKAVYLSYKAKLADSVTCPTLNKNLEYNYAYFPVLLESEEKLLAVIKNLNAKSIFPRRYFYPSLNSLPYLKTEQKCPIAEDIASRILCLPMYSDLPEEAINRISRIVNQT